MGRGLYSANHDRANESEPSPRKKKATKVNQGQTTLFSQGNVAPTEEQRRQLRAAQLQGKKAPVAARDPDMVEDVRRKYETIDGVNYSEPHILPPRHRKRMMHLHDQDIDETPELDLTKTQFLPNSYPVLEPITAADNEGLPRIAELSVTDASIVQVDNTLTEVFRVMRNLQTAAREMLSRAQAENDSAATHHAQQITWITEEALLPWLQEVDDHLSGVIEATPEGRGTQPPETTEGGSTPPPGQP